MMVRRRSVLSKLAFAVLVTFALASHHNGAAVDAYKIGKWQDSLKSSVSEPHPPSLLSPSTVQYKIRYPTSVNDEPELPPLSDNNYLSSPVELSRYTDYEYDQPTGYQNIPQNIPQQQNFQDVLQQESPSSSRFGLNIALNGADRLAKYKQAEPDKQQDNDREMQEQVQTFLKSLFEIEKQKQYQDQFQDVEASGSQNILKSLPQPMKKENVDPLENELFGIQNKPLEDAETMDKVVDDSGNVVSDNQNQHQTHLFQPINQESVSNQNYAEMDILKRKLSSQIPSSSLIKSEPNAAPYQQYRQIANSFVQSSDSSSNSNQTFLASMSDIYFVAMVVCVSSVAICSVIGAGYCFYKVQQNNRQAADVEFPAYGVIGPNVNGECGLNSLNGSAPTSKCSSPPADRKLTQAAQLYHYQHQKQQMISNERNVVRVSNHGTANSDLDSDEENEDGEYTVYECPGLAPTGEMEVKNPLFQDDLTPMSSPSVLNGKPQNQKK